MINVPSTLEHNVLSQIGSNILQPQWFSAYLLHQLLRKVWNNFPLKLRMCIFFIILMSIFAFYIFILCYWVQNKFRIIIHSSWIVRLHQHFCCCCYLMLSVFYIFTFDIFVSMNQSPSKGYLGCSQSFAIARSAIINYLMFMLFFIFVQVFLEYILTSRISVSK